MRYFSLDVETTSLDPQNGAIVQFAIVQDDLDNQAPIDELKSMCAWVVDEKTMTWNLSTVHFHRHRLNDLMHAYYYDETVTYSELLFDAYCFLKKCGIGDNEAITVAGKNVASFDLPFIRACIPNWDDCIKISSRVIDPAFSFLRPGDRRLPSLDECLRHNGFGYTSSHDALGDALDIVRLVRLAYNRQVGK